jgi:mono/diheme cytochrome c family protein
MQQILVTTGILLMLAVAGFAGITWSGVISVAATEPHWPVTYWLMETTRNRSIQVHAAGIVPPANLSEQSRIVGGTAHFVEHCSGCHSAPGVPADDLAEGMYPQPPVLTDAARQWTPGELFWILKNGIKMSGMPAWTGHGDAALWDIVAFLEKLPTLSEKDYADLVMASMHAGGHHMH